MAKHRNLKVKIVSDEKLAGEIGSSLLIRGLINHVYDFRSNPRDKKKPGLQLCFRSPPCLDCGGHRTG